MQLLYRRNSRARSNAGEIMITSSLGNNRHQGRQQPVPRSWQGGSKKDMHSSESALVTLLEAGNRNLSPLEAKTSFSYFLPSLKAKGGYRGLVIS